MLKQTSAQNHKGHANKHHHDIRYFLQLKKTDIIKQQGFDREIKLRQNRHQDIWQALDHNQPANNFDSVSIRFFDFHVY